MTNVQRSRRQVRLSRALGIALTPKAQRIFEKRPYAPGGSGLPGRQPAFPEGHPDPQA